MARGSASDIAARINEHLDAGANEDLLEVINDDLSLTEVLQELSPYFSEHSTAPVVRPTIPADDFTVRFRTCG